MSFIYLIAAIIFLRIYLLLLTNERLFFSGKVYISATFGHGRNIKISVPVGVTLFFKGGVCLLHQFEEGAHGGGDAVLAGDEGGVADVALRRQRQADQIRELAGGSGEAGTDDGPAQPVAHGTHQVKQGVGFLHHVKSDAVPIGGALQILGKLQGAAGQ